MLPSLFITDARINHTVQNIHRKVDQDKNGGNDQHCALHHRIIAVVDGGDQISAHAVDHEHLFGDDGAAQQAAKAIRDDLGEMFGPAVADTVRILYGGSVSSKNATHLIGEPDVDGFLIGGASLDPDELAKIARLTLKATRR